MGSKTQSSKKSYKRLVMWRKANELVLRVYKFTGVFPAEEKFGLTSQLRRASLSVVLNIIEGYARRGPGDLRKYLDIALGSLSEVEYLLELSTELGYLTERKYLEIERIRSECGKVIWTYRKRIT